MISDRISPPGSGPADGMTAAAGDDPRPAGNSAGLLPDPSPRLMDAFRAVATRMEGLAFVNPALAVEAVSFAPWQGQWLGVLLTPWFMNLIFAPRDLSSWQPLPHGTRRTYLFPAGEYDFIGAHDATAGEYQMCSLFSPVLQFDDQETARLVAQLAREALFDVENAETASMPVGNLSPQSAADVTAPGPIASLEAAMDAPQSKRDFLRGRWAGNDRGHRG